MVIHGREIGFRLSVGATAELAELCPDKDFNRLSELLDDESVIGQIDTVVKIIAVLSKWYEEEKRFADINYKPRPLTENELKCLTNDELIALEKEMFKAFNKDSAVTVETEDVKKKEMTE